MNIDDLRLAMEIGVEEAQERIAELEAEVERLRTSLAYYADLSNWYGGFTGDTSYAKEMIAMQDGWIVAQEALSK